MDKRPLISSDLPKTSPPYSTAMHVGPLLFVSGQASTDEQGRIVAGSFAEEFHRAIDNLKRVLVAAGLGLSDVVQVRSYLGRQEDLGEYNELYHQYFSPPYPARTTLVGCLGDLLKFEIDAIAVTPRAAGSTS
ncbi:MAG: RidA family protein [Pirellulales bacterium]|nr:RidA family protein [Pirellulales bacterium]